MSEANYTFKKCSKCKNILELDEFNKNKAKRDGHSTECRRCVKENSALSYAKNLAERKEKMRANYAAKPDEYKVRARQWEQNNPERKKESRAKYRERNREKIKEFSKRDWQLHGEKRRARKKEYRSANPWVDVANTRNRQTRKVQAMPAWANREKIQKIYQECAEITRTTGVKHHVDHYYPLKSEIVCGLHNEFNLRIIPAFDNLSKSNRFPD